MFYLERVPCPVVVTNCNGHVLHTNRDFRQLVASENCDYLDSYFPPASRIFLHSYAWPMLLKNGEFSELYLQLLTTNGQLLPVMTNARISQTEGDGKTASLAGIPMRSTDRSLQLCLQAA